MSQLKCYQLIETLPDTLIKETLPIPAVPLPVLFRFQSVFIMI